MPTTSRGAPFRRADLIAISKPPAGKGCPAETSFSGGVAKDSPRRGRPQVFTPVPANQVDAAPDGYAVAISLALPSNRLWLFSVGRGRGGEPVVGRGKPLKLPFSYAVPPGATQPRLSQRIDTSDARPTQAVLARNPRRGGRLSLWTQQTVANGGVSAVRWYEIDPVGAPRLADNGLIAAPGVFLFDAAISPDRRVDGGRRAFGDSFVVGYNASSAKAGIAPRVAMASSRRGGPLGFTLVREAAGPYRDHTCQDAGKPCRWGDYSGATPDPRPAPGPAGVVWLTAQYSGRDRDPPADANWTTWIWAARP